MKIKMDIVKNNYKSAYKFAKDRLRQQPNRDVAIYYKKNKKGSGGKYYFKFPIKPKRRVRNQIISKPYNSYKR